MPISNARSLALLLLSAACLLAQAPKASIEGRVVNAVSGDPLRRVSLALHRAGGKDDGLTAQPTADGRFAFKELEPGEYRLTGERTGFAPQEYGARSNSAVGTAIHLNPGEARTDLLFKMAPSAVLSGRIVDSAGEPMPNLAVKVLRSQYAHGSRHWSEAGTMLSNDRGEFRIGDLRPGQYLVQAADLNIGIGLAGLDQNALPAQPDSSYAPTYFGNTVDPARASPISLAMGDDRRGLDIQMVKAPTLRIRGHVIGAPEDKPMIVAAHRRGTGRADASGIGLAQKGGAFEIRGLSPGSYLVTTTAIAGMGGASNAVAPVELTDRHIENLELKLGASEDVAGTMAGVKPEAGKDVTISLGMVDIALPGPPNARLQDDGTFKLQGVLPGSYRIGVAGLPPDVYVKAVKLNGKNVDQNNAAFEGAGKLEIVTGRPGARVSGSVRAPDDKPMPNATVVLLPASGSELLFRTTVSGHDGAFELKGVPPGKYKVAAWEDIEPGAYQDAKFIEPFASKLQDLSLQENSQEKLTLVAIPYSTPASK